MKALITVGLATISLLSTIIASQLNTPAVEFWFYMLSVLTGTGAVMAAVVALGSMFF